MKVQAIDKDGKRHWFQFGVGNAVGVTILCPDGIKYYVPIEQLEKALNCKIPFRTIKQIKKSEANGGI